MSVSAKRIKPDRVQINTAHSLVWMKTLEYLHNGVVLRMPTAAEQSRGFRAHEATDVASGLAHNCGVPVALNDEMDWRGPVGCLHRTIMPHMEIHRHSDPVELIPWYQLNPETEPEPGTAVYARGFLYCGFCR